MEQNQIGFLGIFLTGMGIVGIGVMTMIINRFIEGTIKTLEWNDEKIVQPFYIKFLIGYEKRFPWLYDKYKNEIDKHTPTAKKSYDIYFAILIVFIILATSGFITTLWGFGVIN